ncbi:MAG TPA: hypothetical protein VIM79_25510 [Niastella sp.]
MRSPFVFLILLITVKAAAQQEPAMTWPEMKPFKKLPPIVLQVSPATDSADRKLAILNALYNKQWYHAGVQVDAVSMGKVYRMPIDNMLCVVPDAGKNSRMPVMRNKIMPEQMPNAYRGPVARRK